MSHAKTYIILMIIYILQTIVGARFAIGGIIPDAVFVLVICHALTNRPFYAAIFACAAGVLADISSGSVFGLNTIILMYTGCFVSALGGRYFYCNFISTILWTLVATAFFQAIYCVLSFVIWGNAPILHIIAKILGICVYNCVLAAGFYFVFVRTEYLRVKMERFSNDEGR